VKSARDLQCYCSEKKEAPSLQCFFNPLNKILQRTSLLRLGHTNEVLVTDSGRFPGSDVLNVLRPSPFEAARLV